MTQQPHSSAQRGMALIAVLWLVAAMSILVLGATNTVKQHIRATGMARDQVTGSAVAEAAFALALQDLAAKNKSERGVQSGSFQVFGQAVQVSVTPLNGWINLNAADEALLARVFVTAANLPSGPAQALASEVVAWRDQRHEAKADELSNQGVAKHMFESVDDLMLVPGMSYDILARVRPLLVSDLRGGARVDPLAAPPEVLAVLADGNQRAVDQVLRARERGTSNVDTSGLTGAGQSGSTDHYRLRAEVPLDAGKMLQVTQDVALGENYAKVAPWRVLRELRQVLPVGP